MWIMAVLENNVRDLDATHLPLEQVVHVDVEPRVFPPATVVFDSRRRNHLIHPRLELVDQAVGHKLQHDLPLLEAGKPYPHRNRREDRQRRGHLQFDLLALRLHALHLVRHPRIRRQDRNQLIARQNNLTHTPSFAT